MSYLDEIHRFRTNVLANQREIHDKFIPDDKNYFRPDAAHITPEFDDIIQEDYNLSGEEIAIETDANIQSILTATFITEEDASHESCSADDHKSGNDGGSVQADEREAFTPERLPEKEEKRKLYLDITKKKKELSRSIKYERPLMEKEMIKMNLLYCYLCSSDSEGGNVTFTSFKHLQRHFRISHNRAVAIYCCDEEHISKRAYDHVKWHLDENAFKCPYCDEVKEHHRRLLDHINVAHLPNTDLTCPKCKLKFISAIRYKQHLARQCIHECPRCDKNFMKRVLLQRHINQVHTKRKRKRRQTRFIHIDGQKREEIYSLKEVDSRDLESNGLDQIDELSTSKEDDSVPPNTMVEGEVSEQSETVTVSHSERDKNQAKYLPNDAETRKLFVAISKTKEELSIANHNYRPSAEQKMVEMNLLFCHLCRAAGDANVRFDTFRSLQEHFIVVHCKTVAIFCCGKAHTANRAYDHARWHQDENAFKCPYCDEVKENHLQLLAHINGVHMPDSDLTCPKCNMRFLTIAKYKLHIARRCILNCPQCDKQFNKPVLLQRHITRAHPDSLPTRSRNVDENVGDLEGRQIIEKEIDRAVHDKHNKHLPRVEDNAQEEPENREGECLSEADNEAQELPESSENEYSSHEAQQLILDISRKKQELSSANRECRPSLELAMVDMDLLFCHLCSDVGQSNVKFDDFYGLRNHFRVTHYRPVAIYCCDKEHIANRAYDHVRWHLDGNAFKCPYCDSVKEHHKRLIDHIHETHMPETDLTCAKCKLKFISLARYKTHRARGCLHRCPRCNKTFTKPVLLQRHIDMVHDKLYKAPKKTPYICSTCGARLDSRADFDKHMPTHDPDRKKQRCEDCDALVFDLTRHKQRMHVTRTPSTCTTCGKTYPNKHRLYWHTFNVHRAERYPCPVCGKAFKDKQYCREHIAAHNDPTLQYQCNFCEKLFRHLASRRRHHSTVHKEASSTMHNERLFVSVVNGDDCIEEVHDYDENSQIESD